MSWEFEIRVDRMGGMEGVGASLIDLNVIDLELMCEVPLIGGACLILS